jgi:hypothetical protein
VQRSGGIKDHAAARVMAAEIRELRSRCDRVRREHASPDREGIDWLIASIDGMLAEITKL